MKTTVNKGTTDWRRDRTKQESWAVWLYWWNGFFFFFFFIWRIFFIYFFFFFFSVESIIMCELPEIKAARSSRQRASKQGQVAPLSPLSCRCRAHWGRSRLIHQENKTSQTRYCHPKLKCFICRATECGNTVQLFCFYCQRWRQCECWGMSVTTQIAVELSENCWIRNQSVILYLFYSERILNEDKNKTTTTNKRINKQQQQQQTRKGKTNAEKRKQILIYIYKRICFRFFSIRLRTFSGNPSFEATKRQKGALQFSIIIISDRIPFWTVSGYAQMSANQQTKGGD